MLHNKGSTTPAATLTSACKANSHPSSEGSSRKKKRLSTAAAPIAAANAPFLPMRAANGTASATPAMLPN